MKGFTLSLILIFACNLSCLHSQEIQVFKKADSNSVSSLISNLPVFISEASILPQNGVYLIENNSLLSSIKIIYDSVKIEFEIPNEFQTAIEKFKIYIYLNLSNKSNCSWVSFCCIDQHGRGLNVGDDKHCENYQKHHINIVLEN